MAFDGIVVHALVHQLQEALTGGRVHKIAQPEQDEILLTLKGSQGQYRLVLSVNASLPLAYLTEQNKVSPMTAPNFCMLLRKHINNGRIISVTQPGLERMIDMEIEHLDEMGDLCRKHLIIELMGKHSNIIFTDENRRIIDSIKRIHGGISSVREVLPGYDYFIPNTGEKAEPLTTTKQEFMDLVFQKSTGIGKAIYTSYTGISPQVAEELCFEAELDSSLPAREVPPLVRIHLATIFLNLMDDIKHNTYSPVIIFDQKKPVDFGVIPFSMYQGKNPDSPLEIQPVKGVSQMLETYFARKNAISRINQRSFNLRQVVNTALERNYKKYDLQLRQLEDTEKKDKYRIYGELLNTYGYEILPKSKSAQVLNYYTNETITIPLEEDKTPLENSKKYFAKYNKLKRTYEALSVLVQDTKNEIEHLESISTALDIAMDYEDLTQIKEELVAYGFIKNKGPQKGKVKKAQSKPFHYISFDGFHIYVGKNNIQNDELTFKFAQGNDWWFHAKNMPGSHVIVKTNGELLPDRTYEEAARLAAYYSKGRNQDKVEVDYVEKKSVKKVSGAKPGFVIYHSNYSMNIAPDIHDIQAI